MNQNIVIISFHVMVLEFQKIVFLGVYEDIILSVIVTGFKNFYFPSTSIVNYSPDNQNRSE